MKIKLLDEPYLSGILNWEASMALTDKVTALVEEGKLPSPLCFIPLPTADGTLAEVTDLSVLPILGIEKYEIINQ